MKNVFVTDRESAEKFVEIFKSEKIRFRKGETNDKCWPILFETSNRGWKYIEKSELFEKVAELPF